MCACGRDYVILANNLPSLIRDEVKEYLKKTKAEAGATIYRDLKQFLSYMGPKRMKLIIKQNS